MTVNKYFKMAKAAEYGEILPSGGFSRDFQEGWRLPEKGGRFKVRGGILVILPMELQSGFRSGYVHTTGAMVAARKGSRIVVRHWATI